MKYLDSSIVKILNAKVNRLLIIKEIYEITISSLENFNKERGSALPRADPSRKTFVNGFRDLVDSSLSSE